MLDIEQIARGHLGNDSLVRVDSDYAKNSDGESVIWIKIVLKDGVEIDGSQMAGLTDKIWSAILETERDDFPILNYVSQRDYEEGEAA